MESEMKRKKEEVSFVRNTNKILHLQNNNMKDLV